VDRKKKAELLVVAFSVWRAPPSSLIVEKHEQFTPNGRELSSLALTI